MKNTLKNTMMAGLVMWSASAFAAPAPSFESLDKNGDGRISGYETAPSKSLNAVYVEADTDGNGVLSRAEFEAWRSGALQAQLEQKQKQR